LRIETGIGRLASMRWARRTVPWSYWQ